MKTNTIDFCTVVTRFNKLVNRGLSNGLGVETGQMCIEAAISVALGEGLDDHPSCVPIWLADLKIQLNDADGWQGPKSRAKGLRDIGIAQLGSNGVVNKTKFYRILTRKITNKIVPLFIKNTLPESKLFAPIAIKAANVKDGRSLGILTKKWNKLRIDEIEEIGYHTCEDPYLGILDILSSLHYKNILGILEQLEDREDYLKLFANLIYETLLELKSPGALWLEKQKLSK